MRSLHALGDLKQVELNGGIGSEDSSRGDAEKKGVTDVSGCTGDGDNTRFCHDWALLQLFRATHSAATI